MEKVILITGTSSGVGLSLSLKLARMGHIVYASMRDLDKSTTLAQLMEKEQLSMHLMQLDVESTDSITQCVETIIQQQGRIDCLVNNAGVGFAKTTEQASEEEIQQVMNINFMGMVRVTKAVLAHMRVVGSGQVINVSSVGGLVGQPFNEIYCASKFAVEGYTESMASYIQPHFNIKFTAIEPGGISSDFLKNIIERKQLPTLSDDDDYSPLLQRYIQSAEKRQGASGNSVYQTSDEVADCIISVINDDQPPVRVRTSSWANDFCALKTDADPQGNHSVDRVYQALLQ